MAPALALAAEFEDFDHQASTLRRRFSGAFEPSPWIYWSDMLSSALLGWGAFALALGEPFGSFPHIAYTLLAVFALLRGALFIHELVHLKRGSLPAFESVWHLAIGFPLLLPALMYVGSHNDHHRRTLFGTAADPEYAPIANWSRPRIVLFVLGVAMVPMVLAIRWAVVAPLSYAIPALRRFAVQRVSTLAINPAYRRRMPRGPQLKRWIVQEAGAGLVCWIAVIGAQLGWIPSTFFLQWILVGAGILVVNQVRTLAAHGYTNEGGQVDSLGQLLDTINLRGRTVLTALVAPVGLRYHALHHLLPDVPYHSLGTLHRRLLSELPLEAPYRRTERAGILPALRDLWRRSLA